MHTVYLCIGSNIGSRKENCEKVINLIEESGISIKKQSQMYETEPWGFKDQPKFINMALETETNKTPDELLNILKQIEKKMGRTDEIKWGPRIIDIDILLYDDLVKNTELLEIPHPLMHERDFVLKPLCEIAPHITHPVFKKTIKDLLNFLNNV
ncbi:MAG: 2-amino-4-hydroxy-6-hydroxymethyldihydropteridine diphosphokinase [Nitrospiraceae bacterium]|nr:2-amino-4-hydroxy-6-hydroxymethyldihydropteridine diphosphokinase [Nitrospiraceae bacterium]